MEPLHVGLCEDEPQLRSVLERALRREGFRVRLAATGREAVEIFSATPPDLLVLDIGLPDADGRDVCQALGARRRGEAAPARPLPPAPAPPAAAPPPDPIGVFPGGGDDSLVKPFALAELLVRLGALLRRSGGAQV